MQRTIMNVVLVTVARKVSEYFLIINFKIQLSSVILVSIISTSAKAIPCNSKIWVVKNNDIVKSALIYDSANTAQEIEITGYVRDGNGLTMPGVSIIIVGTKKATVSDLDGKYSISAKKGDVLRFSFVGMKSIDITLADKPTLDVVLQEDVSSLNEVVIVGFGKQSKVSVTGAVSTVDVDDMKNNPTSSISNALVGNAAGVMGMMQSGQPGKNISEFWIRGISTFGGGSNPLWF